MAKEPIFSSKSVAFDAATVLPLGSKPDELLASYSAVDGPGKPRPLLLHVNVRSLNQPTRLLELPAGSSFNDYPPESPPADVDSGFLIVEYGDGAAFRSLMMDLKSGSYQLPPAIQARCFANVFTNNTLPFAHQCQVSAAFSEGWQAMPARPVYSWTQPLAVGSNWSDYIPEGARWVSVMSNTSDVPGSGSQILRFRGAGASISLDWSSAQFFPPVLPVELGPRSEAELWTLTNAGPAAIQYGTSVRFYLEF